MQMLLEAAEAVERAGAAAAAAERLASRAVAVLALTA
jgi:hypothetical protein